MIRGTVLVLTGLVGCGRVGFGATGGATDAPGTGSGDDALAPGDALAVDCPNIGDVCSDGTIYVGTTPDGNVRLYTEATTTNNNTPWSFGVGNPPVMAVQTGMSNTVTGAANTAALSLGGMWQDADSGTPGVQPHDAANYCTDLTANGHTDWYLPALDELRVLATNQVAIGGFVADEYWASDEDPSCPADCALAIAFPSAQEVSFRNKYDYRALRCVRK